MLTNAIHKEKKRLWTSPKTLLNPSAAAHVEERVALLISCYICVA